VDKTVRSFAQGGAMVSLAKIRRTKSEIRNKPKGSNHRKFRTATGPPNRRPNVTASGAHCGWSAFERDSDGRTGRWPVGFGALPKPPPPVSPKRCTAETVKNPRGCLALGPWCPCGRWL